MFICKRFDIKMIHYTDTVVYLNFWIFHLKLTLLLTYIEFVLEFTQHWKHVLCKRLVTGKLNGINIWLNNIVIQIKTCLIFHNVHFFIMFLCRFSVKHLIFMKLLKKPAKEKALLRSAVCLVLLDFWKQIITTNTCIPNVMNIF